MCEAAGIYERLAGPIMQFCLGEGIYSPAPEAAKQIRIKFEPAFPSLEPPEKVARDAILKIGLDKEADGWLHVDLDVLTACMNLKVTTVMGRLKSMAEKRIITYVKPDSRAPLRVCKAWSDVPQASKDRIQSKYEAAEAEFAAVLRYIHHVEDEDKAQYLIGCLPTT